MLALVRPFAAALFAGALVVSGLAPVLAQDEGAGAWPAATPEPATDDAVAVELEQVVDGLVDPVNVTAANDGSDRLFVVERVGLVRIVEDGELLEEPFLDIANAVSTQFLEQGLLGLAFHPDYAENGYFFVNYTDFRTNGDTFVVRYQVSADDPNVADPDSAKVILTQEQPYVNHNGGTIRFGPDGYLYVAMGDGGLAGDPLRTAQSLDTRLGKLLRIDVDTGDDVPYAIPPDNPFAGPRVRPSDDANEAGQTGDYLPAAEPEIWAYGLRNPWQFSFDRESGDLYIADVGQQFWEEINVEPAGGEGGLNYGWPWLEGTNCYPATEDGCAEVGVLPVAEFNHADGGCSITGIGTYRGEAFPELDGVYFNSDYCTGKVWGLSRDDGDGWVYRELLDTGLRVTGAGEGEDGTLYLTSCACTFGRDYDPFEDPAGAVWRIVPADRVGEGVTTAPADDEAAEAEAASEGEAEATAQPAEADDATPADDAADGAAEDEAVAETLTVEMVDIDFNPNQLAIPAETEATVLLTNGGSIAHTFTIDELGIDEVLDPGEEREIAIDAPAGEYEFYCTVPGHREAGQVGTLTVE